MLAAVALAATGSLKARATDWLTYHFDNARAGANTNETALTPANVNTNTFFKLFTCKVDAEVYAEPLFMANVPITGQGTHDVVFVATENNTIYAFDANSNLGTNGGLLWKTNLGIAATSALFGTRYHHNVLNPLIGVTGTPVIDPASGTLYVDAVTGAASNTINIQHYIHALNISDGTERPFSPALVTGSVPGTGVDSVNGVVTFNATNNDSRPALTLAGGILYDAFSSFGDTDPFHGWVIGFNATNLQQLTNYTFVTTPNATISAFGVNAGEASLWMGGNGLCVDSSNNLYFETGNGSFSAQTNGGDYGDSFVKLSTSNFIAVADYFAPSNQASMAVNDLDLGSGGPILLPDSVGSAAHPHLLVGAGKEGTFYLVDRDNMGRFSPTTNNIAQTAQNAVAGSWGTPAYFNHWLYNQSPGDVLKAFSISNGVLSGAPVSRSTVSIGGTGYAPTISANESSNAIVWVIDAGAYAQGANNNSSDVSSGASILRAFNATNLAQELYNSSLRSSDAAPGAVKYPVATVANGKVFVGGDFGVAVYGLGVIVPSPVISPNGGLYTNSVTVTLSDSTNGVSIYYTLDGTTPTTHSMLYTGPFTITNNVEVNAIASLPGAFNSVAASASFINSSSVGTGTGLVGSYWANTSAAAFTNAAFNIPATLVETDAVVNFNFGSAGPSAAVGKTNYVARWTGCAQPQFSQPYTFYATADDGALLYVNGQLLINNWVNQAATVRSNTIQLTAQQFYNIELEYYYSNDNGGQVSLAWSSPSTPQAIIPQSQLYPFSNPPPTIAVSMPADGAVYAGSASVTIGALTDTPYNSISQVAFYANGNLAGTLNSSLEAPLYALTLTGLPPNPGGQSSNSVIVSATPENEQKLTTSAVEAVGADWTGAIWQTNGAGTAVAATAGSVYATAFNGTGIGNGLNNTRLRSPAVSGVVTFAGDSLTLNTNTELRAKGTPPSTLNFPGTGGNPGLVLNGGLLNNGDSTAPGSSLVLTGSIAVTGQSYNSAQGQNGGGGGLASNSRAINIAAYLSGSGNMVIMNCSTNLPQIVSCPSNTFAGQWIVQCGWLLGSNANSLGSSCSIRVDPAYTGYIAAMPNASSPAGPALVEVTYDFATSGALTLVNGGQMNLHQNCAFGAVSIEGTALAAGTHSYAELASRFPNNFSPGGSGSITVSGMPAAGTPPSGVSATSGSGQITVAWNPSPGATSYTVLRSTNAAGPFAPIVTNSGTSYVDSAVANGAAYYYEVSAASPPGYTLTAVATDGSGLSTTSAPVYITINAGASAPYGLTTNAPVPAFLNTMPTLIPAALPGAVPALLSQTGVYSDTPNRVPAAGLIPYAPNTPLWSDGALKTRYMAVPNHAGALTPDEQITFSPANSWSFPAGTVFVKNFDLTVNATNAGAPPRRLETRLLVRDAAGAVYGVTYKWRPDNSDADLLTTSLSENISVTNSSGVSTQTWYYPSPADCLTCHTPVANYVLGVNTRQLNGNLTYPASGTTDNQLRALNRLGLFYPAIDEASIPSFSQLAALTNSSAPLVQRFRSYIDANCSQCHQPGGSGITFDARYDTPLERQNITNYPAQLSLGVDNARIVKADDVWRSLLLARINSTNPAAQMPPLARNRIDTNAVQVITDWINSLPGVPALAPPSITPNGGPFTRSITVTLQPPNTNASLYYTLNGTLPTTNSSLYSAPLTLTNSAALEVSAFEAGFNNSVAATAQFTLQSPYFTGALILTNGQFQLTILGIAGNTYVLESSADLINWTRVGTNTPSVVPFNFTVPGGTGSRFYRIAQQ
jgi:uncharacterized repeat protein (TIGR03806 family)